MAAASSMLGWIWTHLATTTLVARAVTVLVVLLATAWQLRVALVRVALRRVVGVDVGLRALRLSVGRDGPTGGWVGEPRALLRRLWARELPYDWLVVHLEGCEVFAPRAPAGDAAAAADAAADASSRAVVRVGAATLRLVRDAGVRTHACARGQLKLDGLDAQIVSFDLGLHDTNLHRLRATLDGARCGKAANVPAPTRGGPERLTLTRLLVTDATVRLAFDLPPPPPPAAAAAGAAAADERRRPPSWLLVGRHPGCSSAAILVARCPAVARRARRARPRRGRRRGGGVARARRVGRGRRARRARRRVRARARRRRARRRR
jgi:hypothetical protein